jgi:hypothetical protein
MNHTNRRHWDLSTLIETRIEQIFDMISEVPTAVTMKDAVLQKVAPCTLVDRYFCTLNTKACHHISADKDPRTAPEPSTAH